MKTTFLLFFIYAVVAFGLLTGLMNENDRGPDGAAVQTAFESDVQPATVTTAAVQAVAAVSALPDERFTIRTETKTAVNAKNSPIDAIISGFREIKPESALSGRTYAVRSETIERDFKYRQPANLPQSIYALPDIAALNAAFTGFGRDTNARAKI